MANHLVAPIHLPALTPPFPKWHDPNTNYDYNAGAQGHSIENCTTFKYKVRDMVKVVVLKFKNKTKPNVRMSMIKVWKALVEAKMMWPIQQG